MEAEALLQCEQWEGNREDWPDAYRRCLMSREKDFSCVLTRWHEIWAERARQIHSGLFFGASLAGHELQPSESLHGSSTPKIHLCPRISVMCLSCSAQRQQPVHLFARPMSSWAPLRTRQVPAGACLCLPARGHYPSSTVLCARKAAVQSRRYVGRDRRVLNSRRRVEIVWHCIRLYS